MARLRPEEFQRYTRLLRGVLGSTFAFAPEREDERTIQVERGIVFPMALAGQPRATLEPILGRAACSVAKDSVIDRVGHARRAYPGLLIYCCARALRQTIADVSLHDFVPGLRQWASQFKEQARDFSWPIGGVPASRGDAATEVAWAALALHAMATLLEDPRGSELAADCFGALSAGQQHGGPFLRATASDNPETLWFHELVLLHAAASYAAQANDALVTAAVMQAADYHLNETQPDHASAQPWALHAFVWRREAQPLADQILHSMQVQQPAQRDGVASMLLADALYCLRLLK